MPRKGANLNRHSQESYCLTPRKKLTPEVCERIKQLGYSVGRRLHLYGKRWEVVSDPFLHDGLIAVAELIPHIVRDPDYLAQKDFEVVDQHENVVSKGTVSSEVINGLRSGTLSIRQRPGPKNSLGLAKFVFPNSYNVYMHDTPATEFSHGRDGISAMAAFGWKIRPN